jgi:hypothetical protein
MSLNRRILAGLGVVVLIGYVATATGVVHSVPRLSLLVGFALGPLAILGVLRLTAELSPSPDPATLRVARLFLVTAFTLLTLMVVLQQMVQLQFRHFLAAAPDAATVATLGLVFKGVNLIQLGVDVAFDLFYTLGMIALALLLYRHPAFGRLVGGFGILSATGLLALNLVAFPYVPTEAGLVDLGPVTGLWWLGVIMLQIRRVRRGPPALAAA